MACTVTPRQVNEDIRERLETAFPGLQVKFTPQGEYTYDMYKYVGSMKPQQLKEVLTEPILDATLKTMVEASPPLQEEISATDPNYRNLDTKTLSVLLRSAKDSWGKLSADFLDNLANNNLKNTPGLVKNYIARVLDTEFRTTINDLFQETVITTELQEVSDISLSDEEGEYLLPRESTIKASTALAAKLTIQNQEDEHNQVQEEEKEFEVTHQEYYKPKTPADSIKDVYRKPRTAKQKLDTYRILADDKPVSKSSDVLVRIARGNHPLARLARHLVPFTEGTDVDIVFTKLEKLPKLTRADTGEEFSPAGVYNTRERKIYIAVDSYNNPESIILHEIIHSLTNDSLRNKRDTPEVQAFLDIYERVKIMPEFKGSYGVMDADEFMTHIFTDSEFIRKLSAISSGVTGKGGSKSIFRHIFESVLAILNISGDNSLLDQAVNLGYQVMELHNITESQKGEAIPDEYFEQLMAEEAPPLLGAMKSSRRKKTVRSTIANIKNDFLKGNRKVSSISTQVPPKQEIAKPKKWTPNSLKKKYAAGEIDGARMGAIQRALDGMRAANVNIQLVETTAADGTKTSHYHDYITGEFYRRVSNIVQDEEVTSTELLKAASKHGNKFDEFVRAFFNEGLTDEQLKKDHFGSEHYYDSFYTQLLEFEQMLKDNGEEVIPGEILLHDPVNNIAGTVDLMTVDAEGNFKIYDLKTMRGVDTNFKVDNDGYTKYNRPTKWVNGLPAQGKFSDSKAVKHQKQLTLYSYILERTYGIHASDLAILPIEIDYDKPNKPSDVETSKVTEAVMRPLIPHKRLAAIKNILAPKKEAEASKIMAPLENSTELLVRYLRKSLGELSQRVEEYNALVRKTGDPALKEQYITKRNQVQAIHDKALKDYYALAAEGEREFFDTVNKEINLLNSLMQNGTMDPYLQEKVFFLYSFVKGEPHPLDINHKSRETVEVNLKGLASYDIPEYNLVKDNLERMMDNYFGTGSGTNRVPGYVEQKAQEIIEEDLLVHNNILDNVDLILLDAGYTEEQIGKFSPEEIETLMADLGPKFLKKVQSAEGAADGGSISNWISDNLLSTGYSMGKDSIIPQVVKSVYNTLIESSQAKFKKHLDALGQVEEKLKKAGITDMDFLYERTETGTLTSKLADVINSEWLEHEIIKPIEALKRNYSISKLARARSMFYLQKSNLTAIDPRKLSIVQQAYQSTHGHMFKVEHLAATQAYEAELKKVLGPMYDRKMKEALENFNLAISHMEHNTGTGNTFNEERLKLEIDPLAAIDLLNQSGTETIDPNTQAVTKTYTFGHPILNSKATAYPTYQYVTFIPKYDKDGKGPGYNSSFVDYMQKEDPTGEKQQAWNTFRDAYEEIAFTYRDQNVGTNNIVRQTKNAKEIYGSNNLYNIAKSVQMNGQVHKLILASAKMANDLKKSAFTGKKGDNSTAKVMKSNYADTYSSYRKSVANLLKFHTTADLLDTVKAFNPGLSQKIATQERSYIITELSYMMANQAFSQDVFSSTKNALESAIMHEAKKEVIPKANLLLEMYKKQVLRRYKDKEDSDVATLREGAVKKVEDFIDRQFYGIGEVVLDEDGNIKKSDSVKNKLKTGRALQERFIKARSSAGTKADRIANNLYTKALEHGFISPKIAAFISDRETVLYQHLDDLLRKGLGKDATVSFTVGDVVYVRRRVLNKSTGVYRMEDGYMSPVGKFLPITESTMDDKFQEYVMQKMDDLGLSVTLSGIGDGFLAFMRFRALGFSPISGSFNRLDGKMVNYLLDSSGKYWEPGANNVTNTFMAGFNIWKLSSKHPVPGRGEEYDKLTYLLNNANVLQSTAEGDETNQQGMSVLKSFSQNVLGTYSYSVGLPEGKNQATPLLNIMQNTFIKKNDGSMVPLFDGSTFPAWDMVDGVLHLKEEFRLDENGEPNTENIQNWEKFEPNLEDLSKNEYTLMRRRVIEAVEAGQGDYSKFNNIPFTRNFVGRALSLMFKWSFMQLRSWWNKGGDFNITRGKTEEAGLARGLKSAPLVGGAATLGFVAAKTGMMSLGTLGLSSGVGIGAIALYAVYRKMKKDPEYEDLGGYVKKNLKQTVDLGWSTLLNLVNIPLHLAYSRKNLDDIPHISRFNAYLADDYTPEDVGRVKALGAQLAITVHTTISIPLLTQMLFGLWIEDDEPDSWERMLHNFINNSSQRLSDSATLFVNPLAIMGQLNELYAFTLANDIREAGSNPDAGSGVAKLSKIFLPKPMKLAMGAIAPNTTGNYNPVARFTGGAFLDDTEYDKKSWVDTVIRDMATDGNYSAKKERERLRTEMKSDIKTDARTSWRYFTDPDAVNKEVDKRIKNLPSKGRGRKSQTELEALEKLKKSKEKGDY